MKTYDCKECDYKTKLKGNLNLHMMAAHESLEFTCSMCEYKTSDKWRLRYHKQSEHEGVKFSCCHSSNLRKNVKMVISRVEPVQFTFCELQF